MGSIINLYTCPSCSRSLSFGSPGNNIAVCTCGNVWQRTAERLESLPLSIIDHPEDYIQPGTTGNWSGRSFVVTGRFRAWFEETAFNYWSIDMGDNRNWYLAEGYGLYAIYEPRDTAVIDRHALNLMKGSHKIILETNLSFHMTRGNKGTYIDIEGAFYKPGGTGKVSGYECSNGMDKVEILEFAPDEIEVYTTHAVEVTTLNLQHTRDGERSGKTFTCKECGDQTRVSTYPYAQSWVCSCRRRYATETMQYQKQVGQNSISSYAQVLMLGGRITLFDITYTVIGFALKEDPEDSAATWREYTLYHKIQGYVFLNESDGHWMLLKEMQVTPTVEDAFKQTFYFNGKAFDVFLKYRFRIVYAQGEFPGNVFDDNYQAWATDFISQPDIWSVEHHNQEGMTWFYGQYIDKSLIRSQTTERLPVSRGIAPAQEKMRAGSLTIIQSTLVALALLLLVQIFTSFSNQGKEILNKSFSLSDSTVSQTFVTDTFKLKKWKSNLEFHISAPVDNSWFEMNATLVNAQTGDEYSLEQGVEYYHGVTDGEYWSEGNTREEAYLSSIPAGTYFLQISSSREMNVYASNTVHEFSVSITNDSTMYRNFWLIGLALLVWPVIMLLLNNNYEKQRWRSSPYSKFNYND